MTRRTLLVTALGMALVEAVVIFLFLAQGHHVDYGDLPTWLAVLAAVGAGWVALSALRAQQQEFARQVRQLERRQADAVDLTGWEEGTMVCVPDPRVHMRQPKTMLAVENNSQRPVRHVRCRLWPHGDDHYATPYASGPVDRSDASSRPLVFPQHSATVSVLRVSGWFAFLFDEPGKDEMRYAVRFTDDAGLNWEIDHDLHLHKISDSPDW